MVSRMPRPGRGHVLRHALFLLLVTAGCDDLERSPTQSAAMPPDLGQMVSGAAAQSLNERGEFELTPARAPADVPIISPEQAGEFARAFLRTGGAQFTASWQRQRGGLIEVKGLRMDPRILYAETPHAPFPNPPHPAYRRKYGPVYLVHFMTVSERVLTIGVSAYGTDLRVDAEGRIVSPMLGGTYFFPVAVSIDPTTGPTRYVPVTPEDAVAQVASATGARIVEVPQLVLRDRDLHPALAQWRVRLDRPVRVRAVEGGRSDAVRELFVGPGRRLHAARPAQPLAKRVRLQGDDAGPAGHTTVDLRRRAEFPTDFDVVVPEQPER